jgi:hypothetical protein
MLELDLSLDVAQPTGKVLLQELLTVTEDMGLPFPPVPHALIPALRVVGDFAFGTRDAGLPLLNLPAWLDEWLHAAIPDYVMYGVEGRGAVSQVLHFYMVLGPVAIFLQHRLGGPYAELQAGRMDMVLGALPGLLSQVEAAAAGGRLAHDEAIAWIDSDLFEGGWARFRHGTPPIWRRGDALESLATMLRGG